MRATLGAAALAAFLASPAAAQTSGRIFDGSLLPSFARLRNVVSKHLLIPVQGIGPESLRDSYFEGRSGGRTHHAIDIHAPHNTPVLAVADGTILKLHRGGLGGTTIYHLDDDGQTRYYYAHLDHYAEGLAEGQRVKKGDVIGYVGDTGNAAPGDYHLHFAVAFLSNLHRWWDGETVNPFYLLRDGTARIDGRGGEEVAGDDHATTRTPARLAAVAVERPRRAEARERSESRTLSAGERAAVSERLEREERAARHRCTDGETGRARARCLEAVQDRFNGARALLAKHVDPRVCTAASAPATSKAHHASASSRRHTSAPTAGPCAPRSESSASRRGDDARESSRASSPRRTSKSETASTRRSHESTEERSSAKHRSSRTSTERSTSTRSGSRSHAAKPESSAHRSRTTHESESGSARSSKHRSTTERSSSSSSEHRRPSSATSGRTKVARERSSTTRSHSASSSTSHRSSGSTASHHRKSE